MPGLVAALVVLALLAVVTPAQAITLPPDFEERALATGLAVPTAIAWAPDGRLFIAELVGRVRVSTGGSTSSDLVLDISDHVNHTGDRGLLGIAVDADFATNHYLYLLYTYEAGGNPDDTGAKTSRLTRVVVRPDNTVANPEDPETVVLGKEDAPPCPPPSDDLDCMPSDATTHSIGTVRSDTDGTLWVGAGDASTPSFNDDRALRTYDERTYVGKLIHIDREGNGLPGHPFCPGVDDLTRVCTKLYAKGLRNPFRFSLRGGGLGPVVGDVGFQTREEVDLVQPGRNYGWPCWEGSGKTPGWDGRAACQEVYAAGGVTAPDLSYGRDVGATVLGGPAYAGGEYPDVFDGTFLVGDYAGLWIKRLRLGAGGAVLEDFAGDVSPLDLALAPSGNLAYATAAGFESTSGRVGELVYCPDNCSPVARASATPRSGTLPLNVNFGSAGSTDSDGDTLAYEWDFGDGSPHSTEAAPQHEYTVAGVYTARLTVSDGHGGTGTAEIPISAGNEPPEPTIESPGPDADFAAGDVIHLEGSATDPEDGALGPEGLEWRVLLHHADHIHPHASPAGGTAEFTTDPDHDADSYYEIVLVARDSGGLESERTIELRPRTQELVLASSPPGAQVAYGGRPAVTAPVTITAAAGFRALVSAAAELESGGRTYAFDRWSDGGERAHVLTVPDAATTLTATYRDATPSNDPDDPLPPPAPLPPPPVGERLLQPAARDGAGPIIRLGRGAGRAAARGTLAGTAFDPSGVRSVHVALRRQRKGGRGCRWWVVPLARVTRRPATCRKRVWIPARLTEGGGSIAWRADLAGGVPAGRYEVLFRAVDRVGNVSRLVRGRALARLVVR